MKDQENERKPWRKFVHPGCLPSDRKGIEAIALSEINSIGSFLAFYHKDRMDNEYFYDGALLKKIKDENLQILPSSYGRIQHVILAIPCKKRTRGDEECDLMYHNMFTEILVQFYQNIPELKVTIVTMDRAVVDSIEASLDEDDRLKSISRRRNKIQASIINENDVIARLEEVQKYFSGENGLKSFFKREEIEYLLLKDFKDVKEKEAITYFLEKAFSIWIQDPFVVLNNETETHLLEPLPNLLLRPEDSQIINGTILGKTSRPIVNHEILNKHFKFHGGNILAGKDFIIAGGDNMNDALPEPTQLETYRENIQKYFAPNIPLSNIHIISHRYSKIKIPNEVYKGISNSPDIDLHVDYIKGKWALDYHQPLYHLDLFISLAGKSGDNKNRLVIPYVMSYFAEAQSAVEYMNVYFQNIVDELRLKEFEIYRNPIALQAMEYKRSTRWYFTTYNNCIVQVNDEIQDDNRVWLPTFGGDYGEYQNWDYLTALDNANIDLWKRLGFNVHPLPNYHPIAYRKGGPHCMIKCLERIN